jgi:glutamate 5-kinase
VAGTVRIDAGAVRALRAGRSLLPSGVRVAEGAFGFGDAVAIVGLDGAPVGRGLVNYAAEALARIAGRRTHEIADLLGAKDFDEVVHRDNLVLTAADG